MVIELTHIKRGLKHLDVTLKRAKRCPICGKQDFNVETILDDWFLDPCRLYDLTFDQKCFIRAEVSRQYTRPKNVCDIQTHHISYVMDITMPLCRKCHVKAHHSKEEPWCKYNSIDKRKDPKYYEQNLGVIT